MPFVNVKMLSGRTIEQKREIAKAITEAMVNIGKAQPENVYVMFDEMEKSDLAKAGKLLSDK